MYKITPNALVGEITLPLAKSNNGCETNKLTTDPMKFIIMCNPIVYLICPVFI